MPLSDLIISLQSNLLKPLELQIRSRLERKESITPIWIVGAPRTGTTLIYQVFCSTLKCTYLTNRVANRYRIAVLTRRLERMMHRENILPNGFASEFGKTFDLNSPHEGGAFFYQFFQKKEPYTTENDLIANYFVETIEELTKPNTLFLSKNTYHSLRIRLLSKLFPDSIFIWVKRDLRSTVKSIYKGRIKNGSPTEWWALNPPGWRDLLHLNPLEQIIWQVKETNKVINNDLDVTGSKFIEIDYEEFCENPNNSVLGFMKTFGLSDHLLRKNVNIPDKFEVSKSYEKELDEEINQLFKETDE